MFFNGYRGRKADYNRRADSAKIALARAIDNTRERASATAEQGEGSGVEFRVPDLLDPIMAYRVWGVHKGHLYPTIQTSLGAYMPKTPREAICVIGFTHSSPHENCSCGYYSAINVKNTMIGLNYKQFALGQVALWGKVIEYTEGYRSQYAYPVEFKIFDYDRFRIETYDKKSKFELREIGLEVENNYGAHFVGLTDLNQVFMGVY